MKFYIPLKDILPGQGKRYDPAINSEAEVIHFIKKAYGVILSAMGEFPVYREIIRDGAIVS